MSWRIRKLSGPEQFERVAFEFLLENEAVHNLFFGIANETIAKPEKYPNDNYWGVAIDPDGRVGGAAFRTPPHDPVVSLVMDNGASAALARDLAAKYDDVGGALAPESSAAPFLAAWEEATGEVWSVRERQRIYRLDEVESVDGVEGSLRPARAGDRETVMGWIADFQIEATGTGSARAAMEAPTKFDFLIDDEALFVWEVAGTIVSMAAAKGPTPNGIRISWVYTPPELRRNGYASAVVAAVSQRKLDEGFDMCFLFTDLDNPTSNHIYQEIGYRPVCDMHRYGP